MRYDSYKKFNIQTIECIDYNVINKSLNKPIVIFSFSDFIRTSKYFQEILISNCGNIQSLIEHLIMHCTASVTIDYHNKAKFEQCEI